MSYCRWSCPVPELTPDVDVSTEKMLEIYNKGGGFGDWTQYLADNDVVLSDAYVYESENGFVCHWRGEGDSDLAVTAQEMAEVLIDGVKRGKRVPQSAIEMLLEEMTDEENNV